MQNLQKFLERFTKSLNKDAIIKGAVIDVVRKRVGPTLKEENVSIKDGILEISCGAALKNELRIKEKGLLEELNGTYGVKVAKVRYK